MSGGKIHFTLLGTGSSGGVPRIGNDWGSCDPSEPKNRRTRCSALIEYYQHSATKPTRVLIDTSPDMRQQLLKAGVDYLDAVFITHDHADQTHGLDDLRALALKARSPVHVHMDKRTAETLIPKFRYCFEGQGDYPPIINEAPFLEDYHPRRISGDGGDVQITPLVQQHGKIKSLGFRIGDLAYCNDVSELPPTTLNHLSGLDVLIIDALRYTPHPTHANLEKALGWINQLEPKQSILTNLHIDMDYQTLSENLPNSVEVGFDGMIVINSYEST